jgi:hypothetical protein
MTLRPLLLASLLLLSCFAARADQHRLICTADTNLSSYEGERDLNYGQSTRLRLKGIQMLALFDFNVKPVADWQIRKATLYLRYAQADRKLRILGISTVGAAWKEGTGTGERKPGEVCFDWRELNQERWAGDATDFTDVSFTVGNTVTCYSEVKMLPNDWIVVDVDPSLVQAVIAGVSAGLAVTDEKGQTGANNDIYSREQSGSEPYLVVEGEPAAHRPSRVQNVTVVPDLRHADFESGAVKVTFKAPPDAFAFLVDYNSGDGERIVARSRIPLAQPGHMQTVVIDQLPARSDIAVDIYPVGATGLCGFDLWVKGKVSASRPRPAALVRPLTPLAPTGVAVPPSGPLRIVAYPDTEKVDPISGNRLEEVGIERYEGRQADDYGGGNAVWDGRSIRLTGARNEFVAYHLLIEATHGTLQHVVVQPAPAGFTGAGGQRGWQPQIGLFRDWYVRDGAWFPEACVPLHGAFDIPAPDNAVPGQRNQSVFVEMLIPRDAAPGVYRSWLTVSVTGVASVKVPIVIDVNSLTLPDTLSFDISLNGYGTLGGAYSLDDATPEYRALEREYHRMAHLHRATLALLGYSHSGHISTHYAPPLAGDGAAMHVTDWSAWDAQFGPYLDGSAFADLPRKSVPITHFYLPFHEDWPADIRAHYHYQPTTTAYPALITEHALAAPPIERALDPEFDAAFVAVARQFAEHFRARGWTRTQFQFYQNDKYFYKDPKLGGRGTSWWLLDEPNHRDDWLALAHFNRLFAQGIGAHPGVSLITREDISRPQWQRDYLDGLINLMVVSGELYTKGPRLREMQERLGVRYWNYGTANAVQRTNVEAEAWAVSAWLAGADGIVPWQTIGEDANFTRAEETALLLPGKRFGIIGPVASLRLKALRRAQQDIEYLNLLAAAKGWDRAQVGAALGAILQPKAAFNQHDVQDAGSYRFGKVRAADFSDARRAAASAISK